MRCTYCGVEVTNYPDNGICVHCGGKLPERPAGTACPECGAYSTGNFCATCGCRLDGAVPQQPAQLPIQPVHIHVQQTAYGSAAMLCPKCGSTQILHVKRGFSWGLGILGFFLFPGFGILLGFCGSKKPRWKCTACSHKWKYA